MSKATPREPSMDEILSSIRQIIADDDAGLARRGDVAPVPRFGGAVVQQVSDAQPDLPAPAAEADEAYGPEIAAAPVDDEIEDFAAAAEADEAEPVLESRAIDDVSIHIEAEANPFIVPPAPPQAAEAEPAPPVAPTRSVSESAPLPDPTLGADLAEQLLEPVTKDVVRQNFARLNSVQLGAGSLTIEGLVRDMLRPMLKDWLDEHLPTMVERMVEKEIARITRGE